MEPPASEDSPHLLFLAFANKVAAAFGWSQQEGNKMRTKTVLATLMLITLGLPLAATAADFVDWSVTLANSNGTPAGSGTFSADAEPEYKTPPIDFDLTVNGVEYDVVPNMASGAYFYLYFNNFTGSLGGFALSSNDDGIAIPCIGFGMVTAGRWDYFLCKVSGGLVTEAERISTTYGSFSIAPTGQTEIWRDNFERPAGSSTVGNGWTEIEANYNNVEVTPLGAPGPGMIVRLFNVRADEPDAAIRRMISTAGYENIKLAFSYKAGTFAYYGDTLKVYYTVDSGTSWTLITSLNVQVNNGIWYSWSGSIGEAAANAPGFGISLESDIEWENVNTNYSSTKGPVINYVVISGTPTADTTPPAVSNVTADDVIFPADVTVTATATDAQSNIKSAEYSRDGTDWTGMSAVDGAFDSQAEDVTATLSNLFVKTYEVCVRATDVNYNTGTGGAIACELFDVKPATLSVAFAGPLLDSEGLGTTELKAEVTGPCASGAMVEFFADLGEGYESKGTAPADLSGVATKSVELPAGGIYDIKVKVSPQDMGGDSVPECSGDEDTGITVVVDVKASSTGGGWYKLDNLTPPRVNFGYTAKTKYDKKLGEYLTSGNLLWIHQDSYRLKGTINAGGKLPDAACPDGFAACAAFAGEGTLYQYNTAYDPECIGDYCEPEWINAIANNPFVFFVNDGGIVEECLNKKKCKEVEGPDQFGIRIELETLDAESEPVYLNGGNLVVR